MLQTHNEQVSNKHNKCGIMAGKKKVAQKNKDKQGDEVGHGATKKSKGKKSSWIGPSLDHELGLLGLRIKSITADGNCFFRALGDQIQGNEGMHADLRQQVVNFMVNNAEDFAPFVEDDESFPTYISRMKKDGIWAGYMEVIAASRALPAHLNIYQEGQPCWAVRSPADDAPVLHLSYHDGMHYNSVRNADDFQKGPPRPIVLKPVSSACSAAPCSNGSAEAWGPQEEARVLSSTACERPLLVRAALAAVGGNVDAAIEYVIEQLAKEDEGGEDGEGEPAAGDGPARTGVEVQHHREENREEAQEEGNKQQGTRSVTGQPAQVNASGAFANMEVQPRGQTADGGTLIPYNREKREDKFLLVTGTIVGSAQEGGSCSEAVQDSGTQQNYIDTQPVSDGEQLQQQQRQQQQQQIGVTTKKDMKFEKLRRSDKPPNRNKPCPCGSKVKYKNCCALRTRKATENVQKGGVEATLVTATKQLETIYI